MARNEEKQLARLNRFYLQQQKEEELKKRPPRPKLETLNSVEGVKKWLPSILRDIDFYVKQMEVPCYPEKQIEEFERRIDHHRGEYKAFIRKLHQLEPDLKTTPWSDRQYMKKRKKIEAGQTFREHENGTTKLEGTSTSDTKDTTQSDNATLNNFIPLSTPVLTHDSSYQHYYGFEKPTVPQTYELEIQMQNEPLQFDFVKRPVAFVQQNVSAISKDHSNEPAEDHQLEFNVTSKSRVHDGNSIQTITYKQNADLMHTVSAVNIKTSRQSHPLMVNSEDQVKCSSCTSLFHPATENYENSYGDCKCKSGVIIQNAKPKANLVSSSNENISDISLFGTLNIPYTDSSSSDGET